MLQLSPVWDFLITCVGMSYVLWNPFIFAIFNAKFQRAAKDYINEEVFVISYRSQPKLQFNDSAKTEYSADLAETSAETP